MIDLQYMQHALYYLRDKRQTVFASGLSGTEIQAIEQRYGFTFPPDLRLLLQTALPISDGFPNWRGGSEAQLWEWLSWPYEGICFDIQYNNFWMEAWGPRPSSLDEAFAIAYEQVSRAPTLIPIYSHRYIPDEPSLPGNPIYSVYQTDIIYYGLNLPAYLHAEFGVPNPYPLPAPQHAIQFWDLLAS